ncbi:MAG: TylF/MycF/NovP-related O-methyltransferase [Acidobacteriota bacterium]
MKQAIARRLSSFINRFVHQPGERSEIFKRCLALQLSHEATWRRRGSQQDTRLGSICEFGVWNGESMAMLWDSLHSLRADTSKWRLYGFDSFEGMPASDDDRDRHAFISEGSFKSEGEERVASHLASRGVPSSAFELIPGMFDESLTEEARAKLTVPHVCFANIDVDYYSSTMTVLKWLEPLLFDGSLLYFDDMYFYNGNPHRGQPRAIHEFNATDERRGLTPALNVDPTGRVHVFWRDDANESSEELQFSKS